MSKTIYPLRNDLTLESAISLDSSLLSALESATFQLHNKLPWLASHSTFDDNMRVAFGVGVNPADLREKWQTEDLSGFPSLEIVSTSDLSGENWVYAPVKSLIYPSRRNLSQNQVNLEAIVTLLWTEYGHSVDGRWNNKNAPGDGGRVMEKSLSDEALTPLKTEDNTGVTSLNGQIVQNTTILNTELTEGNASDWNTFASDSANATVSNDTNLVKTGSQSLKFVTESGFDTGITYQTAGNSHWDLNNATHLEFWTYAINTSSIGFQGNQPVIILNSPNGSFRYEPQGSLGAMSINQWRQYRLPLIGDSEWLLTTTGNPTLADITSLEIHQDTWDYGFTIYYDGLQFLNFNPTVIVPEGDLTEGNLDVWTTFASDGAKTRVSYDTNYLKVGGKSLKFDTASGFDTGVKYNAPENTYLDISQKNHFLFWAYAINNTPIGFQGNQPIVEIKTATGTLRYEPQDNLMANYGWRKFAIPLDGNSHWTKTTTGTPDLSKVTSFEIHQDTWDSGFTVYYDGVEFTDLDANYLPPAGPPPPEGVNPDAINPKVLLYVFDSIIENLDGKRLHEIYGFDDPVTLSNQVVGDLQKSSHGLANYQIVDTQIKDQYPYLISLTDGTTQFEYTDDTYLQYMQTGTNPSGYVFDYKRFIAENNIIERIDKGEIDEVWIYTGSTDLSKTFESVMAGRGAYWINGPTQNVDSDRAFAIMGWNFERGVGEAIHSYGHRSEGIMDHMYGVQSPNLDNNWNKFTFQDRYQTGLGGVGNIHFPVNGTSDYDYANPNFVLSNADDWYNYPNFTGTTRSFNYQEWSPNGIDPQREYLNWWYDHLPHFSGRGTDYYLNNWWRYLTDVDQFKFTRGDLYLTTGIPTVDITQVTDDPKNGEVDVVVDASVDGALGRVDLYLDDSYFATDTLAPYTFSLDLAALGGIHTLVAKAYELQNGTESISVPVIVGTSGNDTFTGTSNNEKLKGLGGNDNLASLAGNDTLDGDTGNDTMTGGLGDDIYRVDSSGDRVIENPNQGTDTIQSSITLTLRNNVENLVLMGTSNISGMGNALNNTLTGNSGSNTLDGGTGNDTMLGGAGNDTYTVASLGDVVMENPGEGTDKINASVSYSLSANVENLTLTGTAKINGQGNSLNNNLTGNTGVNTLVGGAGNDTLSGGNGGSDTLTGGTGLDKFYFGGAPSFSTLGIDTITDFVRGSDKIVLSKGVFSPLTLGNSLSAGEFEAITTSLATELGVAGISSAFIVYSTISGRLFYNPDGATAGLNSGGQFATLGNKPLLTNSDFVVQR